MKKIIMKKYEKTNKIEKTNKMEKVLSVERTLIKNSNLTNILMLIKKKNIKFNEFFDTLNETENHKKIISFLKNNEEKIDDFIKKELSKDPKIVVSEKVNNYLNGIIFNKRGRYIDFFQKEPIILQLMIKLNENNLNLNDVIKFIDNDNKQKIFSPKYKKLLISLKKEEKDINKFIKEEKKEINIINKNYNGDNANSSKIIDDDVIKKIIKNNYLLFH